jgi:hypothetical protein
VISRLPHYAPLLLVSASVVVGVSISTDGMFSTALNGLAGLAWIGAAILLIRTAWRESAGRAVLLAAGATALVLVLLVKPSDLPWAVVGFTIGGVVVARLGAADPLNAATLLPALWLPIHLLVAISRSALRSARDLPASVRTDPPPTEAIVPLAMVMSAIAGGFVVRWWLQRNSIKRTLPASS